MVFVPSNPPSLRLCFQTLVFLRLRRKTCATGSAKSLKSTAKMRSELMVVRFKSWSNLFGEGYELPFKWPLRQAWEECYWQQASPGKDLGRLKHLELGVVVVAT